MLNKLSPRSLKRIDDCGLNLLFATDADHSKHRLYRGFFCGCRWCPFCAWRKARKNAVKISILMTAIQAIYKYEYLFVTLTTPNVPAERLGAEITHFNKSFLKMMKLKTFRGWGKKRSGENYKGFVQGYMKKLEVTYNEKRNDYNPHLHVLVAVKKSYFSRKYLSKADWLAYWQKATGQPEITQVDVKRVKFSDKDNAVLEVAKYSAKDSDYLLNQAVFDEFFSALKFKRSLAYAGIFKDFSKRYDEGELDKYKEKDDTYYVEILMTHFNYETMHYERKYRAMSAEEQAEIYQRI